MTPIVNDVTRGPITAYIPLVYVEPVRYEKKRPKRMWFAKSVNDAQLLFKHAMGGSIPVSLKAHLLGPDAVSRLLIRPGLKPYYKSGRFGARFQIAMLMHMVLEIYIAGRPEHGKGQRRHTYGDLTKVQQQIFRTKEFRYVRDLYLRPEKFREMDTPALKRWALRLTKQGFTMTAVKNILDGYYVVHPIRKSQNQEQHRKWLRNTYIRHHKGKPVR